VCFVLVPSQCYEGGPQVDPKKQKATSEAGGRFEKPLELKRFLERAKGFEPSTPTLARSCSCFNVLPHVIGAVYKKRAGYSADITMTQ
jgi:hypothetical protein